MQNTNAELIEEKVPQSERLVRLNNSARRQMKVLKDNKNIKKFLKWAIIDEIKYPNKKQYKQAYKNQMDEILGID